MLWDENCIQARASNTPTRPQVPRVFSLMEVTLNLTRENKWVPQRLAKWCGAKPNHHLLSHDTNCHILILTTEWEELSKITPREPGASSVLGWERLRLTDTRRSPLLTCWLRNSAWDARNFSWFLPRLISTRRASSAYRPWALARPAPLNFVVCDGHMFQKKILELCQIDGFRYEAVHSMLETFLAIISQRISCHLQRKLTENQEWAHMK